MDSGKCSASWRRAVGADDQPERPTAHAVAGRARLVALAAARLLTLGVPTSQLTIGLVERPYDVCVAQHSDRLLEGLQFFDGEEDCGRAAVDGHREAFVFAARSRDELREMDPGLCERASLRHRHKHDHFGSADKDLGASAGST